MIAKEQLEIRTLSKEEKDVMSHAKANKFYGTCNGANDLAVWEKLTSEGLAVKRDAASWMVDDFMFFLTDEGIRALDAST